MRVFMTTDAVGGVWSYSINLAEALCHRGVHVTLAVLGPAPSAEQQRRANAVARLSLVSTGLALDWSAAHAGEISASAAAVARMVDCEAGADIIHLHTPSLAAFDDFAGPIVISCHSCLATWWQAVYGGELPFHLAWQRDLVTTGLAAAAALIAPSQAFAAATAAVHGLSRLPAVVHNGRTAPACDSATPRDFVFTSGRLWDVGKNMAVLDTAAASLPWPVLAAGSLQSANGDSIALRHARPLGWLGEAAIADHLAAAPVFASAARYEPFGFSVLEAAQAGCALVLSDIETFREIWGDAALYVAADDAAGYAASITGLMRNPARRAAQGAKAMARSARYTVDAMASRTLALYETQLAMT